MRPFLRKSMLVAALGGTSAIAAVLLLVNKSEGYEIPVTGVDLITEVTPVGEKVVAAAIEYNVPIEAGSVSPTSFEIEATKAGQTLPRTIKDVYVGDSPEIGSDADEGHYVIVEFSEADLNAGTLNWNGSMYQSVRVEPEYTFIQKEEIESSDGERLSPSDDKIKVKGGHSTLVEEFQSGIYENEQGSALPYRLFEPEQKEEELYPLVLFLHGGGERGYNNDVHLLGSEGATAFAEPDFQEDHPAFVLAPQAPYKDSVPLLEGWTAEPTYSLVLELLDQVMSQYPIDPDRVYIQGMSMGGIGTWNMIQNNPDLFAAAIAICGYGNPAQAKAMKEMPIWAFHGENDQIIEADGSRAMVNELNGIGGNIQYTEFKPGELPSPHSAWVPVYQDRAVLDWLFSQKRNGR